MRFPLAALFQLRGALAIVAVMAFVSSLGIGVMLPIIPLYAISLGATPRDLGLLTTAFTLANTASQLAMGFILDRLDVRVPLRAGIATYAGANVLISTATSVTSLATFRAIAGLGAGANLLADRVYISLIADPTRLAFVNGVLASANSSGQLFGPAIGGALAQVADLRAPFIVVGITSGIAFLASLTLPRAERRPPPAGAVSSRVFTRETVVLLFANTVTFLGFGGFITTFAPLTTTQLGWSTAEVGIVFSIFGAGSIALGPTLGALADRRGRRFVGSWSTLPLLAFGAGFALGLPRPVLYLLSFAAGGSLAGFGAAWFALLTEAAPEARRGRTFGVINALASLGTIVGANGSAIVWDLYGLPAALASVAAVASLGGPLLLLLRPRPAPALI
ncbi:MAG TPA: MFS transporter [Candidatus Limnocylindria bacterium]|nr:MFS transporter [Candidatus Limnocylindria bacterium]